MLLLLRVVPDLQSVYSQFPDTYVVTHALRLLNYCEDLELGGEFLSYFLEFKPKNPLRA
jgi:hypothetical protein